MQNIETIRIELPKWKTDLLISLFNADGGDGFTESEIQDATDFIYYNKLESLVDVEEVDGDTLMCTFKVRGINSIAQKSHISLPDTPQELIKYYHTDYEFSIVDHTVLNEFQKALINYCFLLCEQQRENCVKNYITNLHTSSAVDLIRYGSFPFPKIS